MPRILLVKVDLPQRKISLRHISRNKTNCVNQMHMSSIAGEEVVDNFSEPFRGSWSFTPPAWSGTARQAPSPLDHSWSAPLLHAPGSCVCCATPLALEVLCIFSPRCWMHAVLFTASRFGSCLLGATVKGLESPLAEEEQLWVTSCLDNMSHFTA